MLTSALVKRCRQLDDKSILYWVESRNYNPNKKKVVSEYRAALEIIIKISFDKYFKVCRNLIVFINIR